MNSAPIAATPQRGRRLRNTASITKFFDDAGEI
jgi:hypothetical protein